MMHLHDLNKLDLTNFEMTRYQTTCTRLTAIKRQIFDKMKLEQMAKSEDERIPHYICEKERIPKPYSPEFLEKRRQ